MARTPKIAVTQQDVLAVLERASHRDKPLTLGDVIYYLANDKVPKGIDTVAEAKTHISSTAVRLHLDRLVFEGVLTAREGSVWKHLGANSYGLRATPLYWQTREFFERLDRERGSRHAMNRELSLRRRSEEKATQMLIANHHEEHDALTYKIMAELRADEEN